MMRSDAAIAIACVVAYVICTGAIIFISHDILSDRVAQNQADIVEVRSDVQKIRSMIDGRDFDRLVSAVDDLEIRAIELDRRSAQNAERIVRVNDEARLQMQTQVDSVIARINALTDVVLRDD